LHSIQSYVEKFSQQNTTICVDVAIYI